MSTLWHGRFDGGPADELLAYTVSLAYDRRLAPDDIAAVARSAGQLALRCAGEQVWLDGDRRSRGLPIRCFRRKEQFGVHGNATHIGHLSSEVTAAHVLASLEAGDSWLPSGVTFFLPVRALSILSRAKFRDLMQRAGLLQQNRCPKKATPPDGHRAS